MESAQTKVMKAHSWVPSILGHGNQMCSRCFITDLEALAINEFICTPAPANENNNAKS